MRKGSLVALVLVTTASAQHVCPDTIPHILYINLNRSAARREHTEQWLQREAHYTELSWTRVQGIDGRQLVLDSIDEEHTTLARHYDETGLTSLSVRTWTVGLDGRAANLACGLSHAKAIAVAYAMGLEQSLIVEDDVQLEA